MNSVVIGIPTFRRPGGLAQLLHSLARLSTACEVSIIVADNDAERHEGAEQAASLVAAGYRWPLRATIVDSRGISQVRNTIVTAFAEEMHGDFLAMIDDDETVDPGWLDEMIRTQLATGADVVGGRLDRRFATPPPTWAVGNPLLSSKVRGKSGTVDLVDSSGNILFTRNCIERASRPVFDPEFGLTGGEDKEAFTRLQKAGARFAWADRAVVTEVVPTSRVTEKWVLQRAFRIGNSDMRVLLRHYLHWQEIARDIFKALAVLSLAPVLWLASLVMVNRRVILRMMIWRAAGKLATFAGVAYREYAAASIPAAVTMQINSNSLKRHSRWKDAKDET